MTSTSRAPFRVLECARRAGVEKLVLCSFLFLLWIGRDAHPEDQSGQSAISYALSKYQGEQAAFHWRQVYALPVNTISIFNAYGTRVRTTGAYGAVFGSFSAEARRQPFTVVGDGTQRRDFVYVTDCGEGFSGGG